MDPDDLIALANEGLDMVDEVPTAGASFASSVSKKLRGIADTVQRTGKATPKQVEAVTNMVAGLQKWVERPTH